MEFHLLDFSDRAEVRLNSEFITHLKTYTKTVTTKCVRLGHHYIIQRDYWMFPEKEPLGKRLFAKWDYHKNNKKPHEPFVLMPMIRHIHETTGLSYDRIESNVTAVRSWGSGLSWPISLPLYANRDWAFLMGLWFSAGGYVSRRRAGLAEEMTVRYAMDKRPFEELVKPVLQRLGCPRDLKAVWYVKKGGHHKLDAHKWRQFGAEPRECFTLPRMFREVFIKFGLPKLDKLKKAKQQRDGRSALRQYSQQRIPDWIRSDVDMEQAFIEGYMNGPSMASQFHRDPHGNLIRFVEPRFRGVDIKNVETFYRFFADYLSKRGIYGCRHRYLKHGHKNGVMIEIGYQIHNNASLKSLYEQFNIKRPDTRARLIVNYYMNQLLLEACRKLSCFEILILGLLMEKEQDILGIIEAFRCEKEETETALRNMRGLKLVTCKHGKWSPLLEAFKKVMLAELDVKEEERRCLIKKKNDKFFSICGKCGEIIEEHRESKCACGGQYVPISRVSAIRKLGLMCSEKRKIEKIVTQTIPSFFYRGVKN